FLINCFLFLIYAISLSSKQLLHMIIGLLKEPTPETRVSLLPEHIAILKKWNVDVLVEHGAGEKAFATDIKYSEAGANIATREVLLETADLVLSISPLTIP